MATAIATSSNRESRSSRRKTLSHANLEDFLCDLGKEDIADENDCAIELDEQCHGRPSMIKSGQVEYTDEQRVRDIYKVLTAFLSFAIDGVVERG